MQVNGAEEKVYRTWGYSASGAEVFTLKEGESLPAGYFDSPAKVSQPVESEAPAVTDAVEEAEELSVPDDWEELQWKQQVALAKRISPDMADEIATKDDAVFVIREHLSNGENDQ